MQSLIKAAVRQRKIVLFIALIVTAFGLYNYSIIPKQENPHINVNAAIVTTVYPGASPEDVEQLVTKKIEDAAAEVSEYDYSSSESGKNVSVVIVCYNADAGSDEIDQANRELREKIDEIKNDLPDDCNEPEVNDNVAEVAGMLLSLSGGGYSYEQLSAYAEEIKDALGEIDGIYKTKLVGEVEKQVTVKVDMDRLNQLGFSLGEVNQVLHTQNLEIPNGALENETGKIYVKTEALYQSLEDMKDIIVGVSRQTGAMVRLKDIAAVYMENEDDVEKCKLADKNAVVIAGYFKDDRNIIPVGKKVRETLESLKKSLPPDLELSETVFQPDEVDNSIKNFTGHLIAGIILVVGVVLLGMGLKNALVISLSIPLTMAATFIMMNMTGVRIETMSLAGLIIALGMIVDDAIVVNDAIVVRHEAGDSVPEATVNAAGSVVVPVFTSTLTTIAAFLPLLFIPGDVGQFISSMPKAVVYALTVSFISAVLVTPALLSLVIKREAKSKGREDRLGKIKGCFIGLLKLAMKHKKATIGAAAALLVFTFVLVIPHLKVAFFPKADNDLMYIDTVVEKVGDLKYTEQVADRICGLMLQEPEVVSVTSGIGTSMPKVYITMNNLTDQENCTRALIKFDLKRADRFKSKDDLAAYLQEKLDKHIVGASSTLNLMELTEPGSGAVGIRLYGEDLGRMKTVSNQLEAVLQDIPGTVKIRSDAGESSYEYVVETDAEKASQLGISNADIQSEIHTALFGSKDSVYRKAGKEYDIEVKSDIDSVHDLENLAVKSSLTGQKALLKQIAAIELKPQIDNVKRYKKERSVLVCCDVKPGYSAVEIENTIENEKLKDLNLEGVKLVFDGEREKIGENFGNVGILGIFMLFSLYIILLLEFKSFMDPAIILLTVPLALIGSMLGLLVLDQPLSFTALLGVVSLMGIVVKNAIILLDYINQAREEGYATEQACLNAVGMRFRPIILTASTALLGLLPLAVSGSELFSPMAVALMSGLLVSTLLTMILIPVIYAAVNNVITKVNEKRQNLAL
ncbi:MAG: efflux RND transporter permease subunit [Syntrophomonas sp.]